MLSFIAESKRLFSNVSSLWGGAKQSPHKPTTTSRNAPPGRKIGQIAARRTGHQN